MGMGGWSIGVLKGRDEREQGKEIASFGDGVRLGFGSVKILVGAQKWR
jgi:hypothetical protein